MRFISKTKKLSNFHNPKAGTLTGTVLLKISLIVLFFIFGLAYYMQWGLCPCHYISAFPFSTVWIFPT